MLRTHLECHHTANSTVGQTSQSISIRRCCIRPHAQQDRAHALERLSVKVAHRAQSPGDVHCTRRDRRLTSDKMPSHREKPTLLGEARYRWHQSLLCPFSGELIMGKLARARRVQPVQVSLHPQPGLIKVNDTFFLDQMGLDRFDHRLYLFCRVFAGTHNRPFGHWLPTAFLPMALPARISGRCAQVIGCRFTQTITGRRLSTVVAAKDWPGDLLAPARVLLKCACLESCHEIAPQPLLHPGGKRRVFRLLSENGLALCFMLRTLYQATKRIKCN